MRFTYKYLLSIVFLLGIFACTRPSSSNETENKVVDDGFEYVTLSSGKKILKAENGCDGGKSDGLDK